MNFLVQASKVFKEIILYPFYIKRNNLPEMSKPIESTLSYLNIAKKSSEVNSKAQSDYIAIETKDSLSKALENSQKTNRKLSESVFETSTSVSIENDHDIGYSQTVNCKNFTKSTPSKKILEFANNSFVFRLKFNNKLNEFEIKLEEALEKEKVQGLIRICIRVKMLRKLVMVANSKSQERIKEEAQKRIKRLKRLILNC